jgi:hypothetical protein
MKIKELEEKIRTTKDKFEKMQSLLREGDKFPTKVVQGIIETQICVLDGILKEFKQLNEEFDKRSELLRFSEFLYDEKMLVAFKEKLSITVNRYLENLSNSAKRN